MGYTHGKKWNDEKIKQHVLKVVESNNLDRMPSQKECITYYGDCSLSNAVARRYGGWYGLAKELGLHIKQRETYLGKKQEILMAELLISKGFEVERMAQNFPYDFLIDNSVKVDVKAGHLYHGKTGNFYTFNLEKKFATCDVYILLCLDDEDNIIKTFIVQSKSVVRNTQISIGEYSSKYDKYRDKWDYMSKISKFFEQL